MNASPIRRGWQPGRRRIVQQSGKKHSRSGVGPAGEVFLDSASPSRYDAPSSPPGAVPGPRCHVRGLSMYPRHALALLLLPLLLTALPAAPNDPPLPLIDPPPHISTDKSVKFDYDIVYV